MTTNATPPAETAKDKESPNTDPAKDATLVPDSSPAPVNKYAKPAETVAKVETPPAKVETPPAKVETTKLAEEGYDKLMGTEERLTFHEGKYEGFEFVKMRLIKTGCIQYDPANPDLVLDTADKRGKTLPLTPFFKSRIGVTLELVFK